MQETAQQYIQRILGHVEGQDAMKVQRATPAKLKKLTQRLTHKQLKWKAEPGKWSITEIVAHMADVEIAVGWRMRSIIGSSGTTTQPFDQDAWALVFEYGKRDVKRSLETFRVLREANLAMLSALPREAWDFYGMHLERGKETITQMVRLLAGHDTNHLVQIETALTQMKNEQKKKLQKKKR